MYGEYPHDWEREQELVTDRDAVMQLFLQDIDSTYKETMKVKTLRKMSRKEI